MLAKPWLGMTVRVVELLTQHRSDPLVTRAVRTALVKQAVSDRCRQYLLNLSYI